MKLGTLAVGRHAGRGARLRRWSAPTRTRANHRGPWRRASSRTSRRPRRTTVAMAEGSKSQRHRHRQRHADRHQRRIRDGLRCGVSMRPTRPTWVSARASHSSRAGPTRTRPPPSGRPPTPAGSSWGCLGPTARPRTSPERRWFVSLQFRVKQAGIIPVTLENTAVYDSQSIPADPGIIALVCRGAVEGI